MTRRRRRRPSSWPRRLLALGLGETTTDTFTYTVTDPSGLTDTATVMVTIVGTNDAPVLTADTQSLADTSAADAGTAVQFTSVLANDSDAENDALSVVTIRPLLPNPQAFSSVSQGVDGVAHGAYGDLVMKADGTYTYTPNAAYDALTGGQQVDDVFKYGVQDANGATSTSTLTIHVTGTNDTPVLSATLETASFVDTAGADTVGAAAGQLSTVDPDLGDTQTIRGRWRCPGKQHDQRRQLRRESCRQLRYALPEQRERRLHLCSRQCGNQCTPDGYIRELHPDGQGQRRRHRYDDADCQHHRRQRQPDGAGRHQRGCQHRCRNAAIGTAVGITAHATDVDAGDTVTYSLTNNAGGRFAIDATTGVVTVAGALDYETNTSHTITVQASDGHGGTSTQDFTIGVSDVAENAAPTASADSVLVHKTDASNFIIPTAALLWNDTDLNGDTLSVSSVTSNATLSANHERITFKVTGPTGSSDSFGYTATDAIDQTTATATVTRVSTLSGTSGHDILIEAQSNANIQGGLGDDVVAATVSGSHVLYGDGVFESASDGDDLVIGADNSTNVLYGGGGDDLLIGGAFCQQQRLWRKR